MTRPLRRLIGPLAVGTLICTVILNVYLVAGSGVAFGPLSQAAILSLFILPFEALGLILLMPLALYLCSPRRVPHLAFAALLMAIGALLGVVVVLPISNIGPLQTAVLPGVCGAVSALIWLAFNRDVIQRQA